MLEIKHVGSENKVRVEREIEQSYLFIYLKMRGGGMAKFQWISKEALERKSHDYTFHDEAGDLEFGYNGKEYFTNLTTKEFETFILGQSPIVFIENEENKKVYLKDIDWFYYKEYTANYNEYALLENHFSRIIKSYNISKALYKLI